jgi:heat-inducible transcriptional repressor
LNRQIEGNSAQQIELLLPHFHEENEREAMEVVLRMMAAHDQEDRPIVYYDGLANILSQMELSLPAAARGDSRQHVVQSIRHMLDLLQQGLLFRRLLPQVEQGSGVQVFIGGEGEYEDLRQFSVIVSRYGAVGGGSGLLGVLGPTRMHYGRAVAVVRFMTELLSDLAGELNG